MLRFRPVTLHDKAAIERCTMPAETTDCDLAFANMFCWQPVYRSAWAEADGFLVIRFHIGGSGRIGYMQPVGRGDFTHLIPLLRADAEAHGQRLRIVGLTERGCEMLRNMPTARFAFESDPAWADYLYAADDLRHLPGRRYQPKRNRINRFTAEHPDYRYEPLTPDRFDECLRLERAWRQAHEGHTSELCAEQQAMQRGFAHFDELGLLGGCVYVGDRLVAFTYGSAVNGHTFDTHFEKADAACDGAFAVINKLFAEHLPARFTRINREEDLGLEGLRRAKRSYHPVEIAQKHRAVLLDAAETACKELWTEAFGDDETFVDSFLLHHYRRERMLTAECDRRMAAMLHLLPFRSELGRTTYIYGVATAAACRNRGLAGQLMREAMRRIDERGDDAAILIPSPEKAWLRDFYGRFGFAGAVPAVFRTADGFDFGTGTPEQDLAMVWRRRTEVPLPEELTCYPE